MVQIGLKGDDAPEIDPAALIEEWLPKARRMAWEMGLEDPDAAAAEALEIIYAKGYWYQWRPTGGRTLKSYVSNMIKLKLISWARTEAARRRHEAEWDERVTGEAWLADDAYEEPGFVIVEGLQLFEAIHRSIAHAGIPARSCPAEEVFAVIVREVLAGRRINYRKLARRLGTSESTLREQRDHIRIHLADLPEAFCLEGWPLIEAELQAVA